MNVLIVAKTRMSSSSVCVGGIALESKKSVRLLPREQLNQPSDTPLAIGQIWEMQFTPVFDVLPPHLEDVFVNAQSFVRTQPNLKQFLLNTITPFEGAPENLFGGAIHFMDSGRGYVDKAKTPRFSTCFWIPDQPLQLRVANVTRYEYANTGKTMTYVGLEPPLQVIPAGTLVRMSLARWWHPESTPDMPDRCYLQLSGWYL